MKTAYGIFLAIICGAIGYAINGELGALIGIVTGYAGGKRCFN